jgi:hypothetical protein
LLQRQVSQQGTSPTIHFQLKHYHHVASDHKQSRPEFLGIRVPISEVPEPNIVRQDHISIFLREKLAPRVPHSDVFTHHQTSTSYLGCLERLLDSSI